MLTTFLKMIDAFGHETKLTTKKETEQTSKIGGTVSALVYILVIVYIIIKGQKMANGNLDLMTSTEVANDLAGVDKVHMHGIIPYIVMYSYYLN